MGGLTRRERENKFGECHAVDDLYPFPLGVVGVVRGRKMAPGESGLIHDGPPYFSPCCSARTSPYLNLDNMVRLVAARGIIYHTVISASDDTISGSICDEADPQVV